MVSNSSQIGILIGKMSLHGMATTPLGNFASAISEVEISGQSWGFSACQHLRIPEGKILSVFRSPNFA